MQLAERLESFHVLRWFVILNGSDASAAVRLARPLRIETRFCVLAIMAFKIGTLNNGPKPRDPKTVRELTTPLAIIILTN